MIQTNYVPLEHPYRVVYYNGVIGIQIGSLILAIEKQDEEGKRIVEIKTHPVVSYSNTEKKKEITGASYPSVYAEAVVWDKVEQCEVTTLAIENGKINWDELFYETRDYIWKIYQKSEIDGYSAVIRFSDALERLGVEVSFPDSSNIVRTEVCLCTWKDGEGHSGTGTCLTQHSQSQQCGWDLFYQCFPICSRCKKEDGRGKI